MVSPVAMALNAGEPAHSPFARYTLYVVLAGLLLLSIRRMVTKCGVWAITCQNIGIRSRRFSGWVPFTLICLVNSTRSLGCAKAGIAKSRSVRNLMF